MGMIRKHPAVFFGLAITVVFFGLAFLRVDFIDALDLKFYDVMMHLRADAESPSEIVIVDIDDDSIEKLGRWPWSRSLIAEGVRRIDAGSPRIIGLNFILSEPEAGGGLKELEGLRALFSEQFKDLQDERKARFLHEMSAALQRLDNDARLVDALKESDKVVLPVFFRQSAVVAEKGAEPDDVLAEQALPNVVTPPDIAYPRASEINLPLPAFLSASRGIGHINLSYDMDGKARRERLFYEFEGLFIPSYTLRLAALFLNVPKEKIRVQMGTAVHLGSLKIPTTTGCEFLISFKGPRGSFKSFSYFDVVNEKVPASVFKNKLVMVSPSAAGIMNPLSTPTDPAMSVGEFSAHTIWAILNKRFINQPAWSGPFELLMLLALGAVIAFLLPRFKAMIAAAAFVALLSLLVGGAGYSLASGGGRWIPIMYPVLQLVLGYIGVVSLQYLVTETGKQKAEGESAETNRMLGVSFQSQGMLDMAFDKFRRVPVDGEMKDVLYNLALDFERKRQFNKAVSVYEYIEEHDSKFKDIPERKKKLVQASETMVFGDGFLGGSKTDTLVVAGTDTRPTLGRYEVLKQLGKGAMGVVYLGQDPRINRTTAIKTFRFAEDFEPEEAQKMKERFFREAESAGTLSHPNIVTIYDAGDEQDLAYIAMEYLEGEDLQKYTKKDNLLPVRKVIDYVADVADALDYAHQKGIVHRDIKPANIMLLKTGVVKITDFGIARITATSQTQTGVVKGTPYYMSPEQISGEKVDGRSDVFSLGTMLYQLLTGALPFFGDSPAALMHQIMNVAHPDPRKYNPKLVKPLVAILNKALEKDTQKRYQRAAQLAGHLRELARRMDALVAQKAAQTKSP